MDVVQVNGSVIGELSRLVKKVGEQQREVVLELSKELGKHNKMIEQAMAKEDRLLAKINRIEEKIMQKELYNYTNIQQQIKRRKELAAIAKVRNKEDEENVIPAIFQQMEQAEDSEGFDSCEEGSEATNINPFQDFNKQIQEVEDENVKLSIQIGRKMIVDFIDSCYDTDFEDWKLQHKKGGKTKQYPISTYIPQKQSGTICLRTHTPLPDCKMEDILPFLLEAEMRLKHEAEVEKIELVKDLPVNSKLFYVLMKQMWPVGARDFLILQHKVIYQDKAWIVSYSVEDEDVPQKSGLIRIEVIRNLVHLKPNPEIRGYTMIIHNEFQFGGNIPSSMVLNKQVEGSAKGLTTFQNLVEEQVNKRQQNSYSNQQPAQQSNQIIS